MAMQLLERRARPSQPLLVRVAVINAEGVIILESHWVTPGLNRCRPRTETVATGALMHRLTELVRAMIYPPHPYEAAAE